MFFSICKKHLFLFVPALVQGWNVQISDLRSLFAYWLRGILIWSSLTGRPPCTWATLVQRRCSLGVEFTSGNNKGAWWLAYLSYAMPDVSKYFSDFFNGSAPADDYYIVFGLVGGLLLICWTACCIYFCIDFGNDNVSTLQRSVFARLILALPYTMISGCIPESRSWGLKEILGCFGTKR